MKPRTSLPALLAVCAAAVSAAGQDGLRPGETARDFEDVYPASRWFQDVWAVRIVDAWTGRPIPGATVRVPNHVGGGATVEDIFDLCSARTDSSGWARMPYAATEGWKDYVVADAPGYAPDEHCTPGTDVCELTPGTDVPIVLLDYTGRPVAGAHVALNLGCGHIADQRETTTDANGLAILHSIDPERRDPRDVWIEARGLHCGTLRLSRTWRPGSPPVPIHASPGVVVEGRVVAADGHPVAGARVGSRRGHRPWVRTGADGRFRLVGVEAWTEIDVFLTGESAEADMWFWTPPEGVTRTVVDGASGSGVLVTVRVRGPDGEAAAGARVVLVRTEDGLTAPCVTGAAGTGEFSLPPGRYEVLIDGELGTWGDAHGAVELKDGAPATVDVTVPRNPTVRVDASRLRGIEVRVGITTARQFRELKPEEIDGKDVPVPAEGRATFRVSGEEDDETFVRFIETPSPGPARDAPLVLDRPPPTRVSARLVGPAGRPAAGTLAVHRRGLFWDPPKGVEPTAEPSVETRFVGTVDWVAEPVGPGLGVARGTIVLPEQGGRVDLGEVRLAPAPWPVLRVEVPPELAGESVEVTARVLRTGYGSQSAPAKDGGIPFDADAVERGDVVRLSLADEAWLPCLLRIDGPPPWTARWPTASLRLRVLDGAGTPVHLAKILVDGAPATSTDEGGVAVMRGLSAGAHDVIVAEEKDLTKVLHLDVRDGESREIEVRLVPRK